LSSVPPKRHRPNSPDLDISPGTRMEVDDVSSCSHFLPARFFIQS
jgi:hypothetical protein